MSDQVTRIAMWSGPRNISTAMMRAFENRADTVVTDEPFYACYLQETGADHPGRDLILKAQPTHWQAVVDDLLAPLPAGRSVFYQKHMCHHMLPGMDMGWTDQVTNAFLIRDPRLMIGSYVKTRAQVTLDDLGIVQELEIFNRVADRLGKAPPVIDSAAVLAAPRDMLSRLCDAIGIPFDANMLSWPKGRRDSDGVWAPWWYKGVENSTGFKAPEEESLPQLAAAEQKVADAAMPVYEALLKHAL